MKLIKPSFTIIEQGPGLEGIYRQIELAGRTCYKSEDKITPTSAKEFVDRMIKSGHGAMLEHGTVYLHMEFDSKKAYFDDELALKYHDDPHTKAFRVRDVDTDPQGKQHAYITTNLRVLVENEWLDDLKYLCEPTEYHEKRYTVKFTCDRGVTHEFVRHRVFSFAQESTRYCNYSKDKFGGEVTFILPPWLDENDPNLHRKANYAVDEYGECLTEYYYRIYEKGANEGMYVNTHQTFAVALQTAENLYFSLLENGWKAQEARAVLPNAVKAELVMTGFISDWQHFFELRCASTAHPQARELALSLKAAFINKTYL
jgi:thymidylate synthase (FAD)